MKRVILYSVLSILPLALLLGISSASEPNVSTSAFVTPPEADAAPSCRRVHGAACSPEGATIRCSIADEVRLCVCERSAWNCR